MTQTDIAVRDNPARSFVARLAWIVLILATLYVCYFHNLGAIGLVGPDEPRYAWIARAMAETGDWVTPRLYGKPWFEKPVLYYWGAAICFKLLGVSETAARLPSAISALLATLGMAWLAWRVYGGETARWLLLVLPTTVGMIGFSRAAAPDMPFAAMLTLAMAFAAMLMRLVPAGKTEISEIKEVNGTNDAKEARENSGLPQGRPDITGSSSFTSFTSSSSFNSLFFGVFLGLAVLAKGPAAIILTGGGVLVWALFTKHWRDAFRCFHPAGIVSFCLTALPWYVVCARRNPDFFRIFIIEHNFKRYLTPEFQHIQPIWFYIPILIVALLPWTPLLGAGVRRQFRRGGATQLELFFIAFVLFCVVFFSVSKSKLPGYILPAIPALSMLLSGRISELWMVGERASRWLVAACGLLILALIPVTVLVAVRLQSRAVPTAAVDLIGPLRLAPVVLLVGGVTGLVAGLRRSFRTSLIACGLSVLAILVVVLHTGNDPSYRSCVLDGFSVRLEATLFSRVNPHMEELHLYSYRLNRAYEYPLNFYLQRELTPWPGLLERKTVVFAQAKYRDDLRRLGLRCSGAFFEEPLVDACWSSDLPGGF